jgi:hypothetical protein
MERYKTSINDITNIKDATKYNYLKLLDRLIKANFNFTYVKSDEQNTEAIEKFLNSNFKTPNQKLDVLKIIMVLKIQLNKPVDKLRILRTKYNIQRTDTQETNTDKKDNLMKYEEFIKKIDELYKNKKYLQYILNYLILNYGVRNADLLIFLDNKPKNDDKNYLSVIKNKVYYIRNNYKTVSTYGTQQHEIKDPKFKKAVKELKKEIKKDYTIFNKPLEEVKQISNTLKRLLILSEGDAFKMIINHYYQLKDSEKIGEISKTRGTAIPTVSNYYNLNYEPPIIRQV